MTSPLELHTELIALEENDVLVEDERVEPSYEGPLGVRSLVELCRGSEHSLIRSSKSITHHTDWLLPSVDALSAEMMRLATRYADIGDLQYAQHELFFRTRPVEQLAELEDNSPVSWIVGWVAVVVGLERRWERGLESMMSGEDAVKIVVRQDERTDEVPPRHWDYMFCGWVIDGDQVDTNGRYLFHPPSCASQWIPRQYSQDIKVDTDRMSPKLRVNSRCFD